MGGILNCKKNSNDSNYLSGQSYSQLYYQNYSSNTMHEDITSPKEKINLCLSISNACSAYYSVSLILSDDDFQTNKFLGKTNIKQGRDITFDTTITLDYYFEKRQRLRFIINGFTNDLNTKTNEIELNTTVASIMGAKHQKLVLPFKEKSNLIVVGSTIKNSNTNIRLSLLVNTQGVYNCAPFYVIKKKIELNNTFKNLENDLSLTTKNNQINETETVNSTWITLYKSEISAEKEFEFIKFKEVCIPVYLITNEMNYNAAEVMIEVHDNYNQKLMGSCVVTLEKLLLKNAVFLIKASNSLDLKKGVFCMDYVIKVNCSIEKNYRFLDYLRGGLQISLIVGIDFTGSNGDPFTSSSLHYITAKADNSYEKAIKACASTVAFYDSDQLFPVFGYGGILPNTNVVNHCFNVNFQDDPNVKNVEGIIGAYRNSISRIKLFGPTNFAPLINRTIQICKQDKENYVYHILMILTDGIINDMADTIDALVDASFLPISVIIIGIGNNDFESMNVLDADTEPLISSKKVKAQRDLVQFVPFYKFQNNEKLLAEEVLAEVPYQVEEYFKLNKQVPRDAIFDNF